MPMIDIYAPAGLIPDSAQSALMTSVVESLLGWEGAPLASPYLENTGVYLHVLPAAAVRTAAGPDPRTVRVQVITPPGALSRTAQKGLVSDVTRLVAEAVGDAGQVARTWVLLSEAAEGGWGIAGTALGREEFAALASAP